MWLWSAGSAARLPLSALLLQTCAQDTETKCLPVYGAAVSNVNVQIWDKDIYKDSKRSSSDKDLTRLVGIKESISCVSLV